MKKDEILKEDKLTKQQAINGVTMAVSGKFARYGANYILIIANFIAIGLMTLLSIGFQGWRYLLTPTFFLTSVALFIIYISTHWAAHTLRLKKLRDFKNNNVYMDSQEELISRTTNTTEWVSYNSMFLSWRGVEKKKDAWRVAKQNELVALDKKYKKRSIFFWVNKRRNKELYIDRRVLSEYEKKYLNEDEISKKEAEMFELKQNNPYTIYRTKILEQITDNWIAKNIDNFNISYDDVSKTFIESGTTYKQQNTSQSHASYWRENWQSRVANFAIAGFLTAFTVDLLFNIGDPKAWFVFITRVITLTINIVFGNDYGDGYYMKYDIHNMRSRVSLCNEFKAWALAKNILKIKGEENEKI